jgi:hypothetical protein
LPNGQEMKTPVERNLRLPLLDYGVCIFFSYGILQLIPYVAADHTLIKRAKELFDKLYERRQLIRLIGVSFSDLIPCNYQIDLFNDTQENIRLYQAIDSIKRQYGGKLVMHGGGYV